MLQVGRQLSQYQCNMIGVVEYIIVHYHKSSISSVHTSSGVVVFGHAGTPLGNFKTSRNDLSRTSRERRRKSGEPLRHFLGAVS